MRAVSKTIPQNHTLSFYDAMPGLPGVLPPKIRAWLDVTPVVDPGLVGPERARDRPVPQLALTPFQMRD
jgi:hypothetical protein